MPTGGMLTGNADGGMPTGGNTDCGNADWEKRQMEDILTEDNTDLGPNEET